MINAGRNAGSVRTGETVFFSMGIVSWYYFPHVANREDVAAAG
jgi:hypothetical protein